MRITWARCIPLNSRSKAQQRATLLLLTWIYSCRSGGAVSFTLPFMTNVTISISTSQIFRSWVAIVQPRPPMASLFCSLYGMPGLAPRMDVLSWGRRDFQIRFSNRDTSRNAWNRHWGSFMVDTGILSNNMKFPLTDVKWHSVTWPYTMTTPYWSDCVPNSTFYRILRGFHRTFATGVACRQGTLTPPDTCPVPLGLAYVLLVETNSFPNLSLFFRTMLSEYPSELSRFCLLIGFIMLWINTESSESILMNWKCIIYPHSFDKSTPLRFLEEKLISFLWVYYTIPFGFSLFRYFGHPLSTLF